MTGIIYLAEPPAGEDRFADTFTMVPNILAAGIITNAIALAAVVIRTYTKLREQRQPFQGDDFWIIVAMIGCIVWFCFIAVGTSYGFGHRRWQVPRSDFNDYQRLQTTGMFFSTAATTGPKISLLLVYRRLTPSYGVHIATTAIIGFTAIYTALNVGGGILGCVPVSAVFKEPLPEGTKCGPRRAFFILFGFGNAAVDIAIVVLAVIIFAPLRLPKAKKISTLLLFSGGLFICGIACARALLIFQPRDFWGEIPIFFLNVVECTGSIIIASTPVLSAFVKKYIRALRAQGSSDQSREPRQDYIRQSDHHKKPAGPFASESADAIVLRSIDNDEAKLRGNKAGMLDVQHDLPRKSKETDVVTDVEVGSTSSDKQIACQENFYR
ncbi:unnamed protein product [Clonostachys rosea f. rosea IK726]|uniref:Rhodopsin domain-containing protein n=2 Tax=Bionectria ochroleuca TaxID=29856 RepID=A0A0B7K2Y6_BIOOC|nr:unnamed protein product [Clonostachys rosea f. rosea IK726]